MTACLGFELARGSFPSLVVVVVQDTIGNIGLRVYCVIMCVRHK